MSLILNLIFPQSKTAGVVTLLQNLITDALAANRQTEQTSLTLKHVDSPNTLFRNRIYLKAASTITVIGNSIQHRMANVIGWIVSSLTLWAIF